jgi:hypothetical protein
MVSKFSWSLELLLLIMSQKLYRVTLALRRLVVDLHQFQTESLHLGIEHISQETNDRNSPSGYLFSILESTCVISVCRVCGSPCKDSQEIDYTYVWVMCSIYLFTWSMLGQGFPQNLEIRHQLLKSFILTPKCSSVYFPFSAKSNTTAWYLNPAAK